MDNSDKFGLCIHHGGFFHRIDGNRHYIGDKMVQRLDLDAGKFGMNELDDEVKKLGYVSWKDIYFRIPYTDMYNEILDDGDVTKMLAQLRAKTRMLHIYVTGGKLCEDICAEETEPHEDWGHDAWVDEDWVEDDGAGMNDNVEVETECEEEFVAHNSDEDSDYIQPEVCDYSDDEMEDDELLSDEEYTEARKQLRDNKDRVLGDEFFNISGHECGFSDYEDSEGDVYSSETDEDADTPRMRRRIRRVVYDRRVEHKNLQLVAGMRFEDGFEARDALRQQAIEDDREIRFKRVSKVHVEAKCKPPCKWRCYGSIVKATGQFILKTVDGPHTCTTTMRNKQVSSNWIAKEYLNVFRHRPDITVREVAQDIQRRFNCYVGRWKLYKARDKVIKLLRGSVTEHYAKLRSYILELQRADKEGRFELHVDVGAVFKGIYVGFSGLRKGFLAGCRRVIGVDGAFLKTYLGGVLLCAVGKDANNQMYPIAWAVVEIENLENWSWFLKILVDDLGLGDGAGTCFISDQQKGLLRAVSDIAPLVEHRNCARHVFINWKKSNKGLILKHHFWKIVRSTHMAEYNAALDGLMKANEAAYQDFIGRDTTKFCKVFINPYFVCDMTLNNISETFNGYILNARGKHVIHMLEEIRSSLMERLHRKSVELRDCSHRICPEIVRKIEEKKHFSRYCVPRSSSDILFEVENYGDRFVVNVRDKTCSCRGWDISGIPCIHACAAIHLMRDDATNYCSEYFTVERYKESYTHGLPPLNGERMWPTAEGYPVLPPPVKKMPGRPKKKRKRNPCEENPQNPNKLRRTGVIMTCTVCKQEGHNRRSHSNPPVPPPKPKGKPGRPRKTPQASQTPQVSTIASTSRASTSTVTTRATSSGMTSMSAAGNVFTRMPKQRTTLLIPGRLMGGQQTVKTKQGKGKTSKKKISTQESQT